MSRVKPFQFKLTHPPGEEPIESEEDEGEDYPQACTSSAGVGWPYSTEWRNCRKHEINIDYFMVGERVRFLFTSCEESQTNE